jgi:ABC-type transport system involved in multi-copper enzyme maturation permease subunit
VLRSPHLQLIAKHSVRHSLRGGAGLIAILATLGLGLILASIVLSPLEQVDQQLARHSEIDSESAKEARAKADQEIIKIADKAVGWVMDASPAQEEYLTTDKPALVSAVLTLLMIFGPLFACLAGFNQTSGDIGSKGLRYLLIRTERENIFLGRFIGTTIMMAVVYALLFVILAIYLAVKVSVHPTGDMMLWLAGGYLRILMFSVPYIALCAWISSSFDSPFGSLVLSLLFAYVLPIIVIFAKNASQYAGYLDYLVPWGYKWWLFSEQPAMVAAGVAVMAAFSAGLIWVGNYLFQRRDL